MNESDLGLWPDVYPLALCIYTDIDECSYGNDVTSSGGPCGSYSTCLNTVGSYLCQCIEGYFLTDAGLMQRPLCTGLSISFSVFFMLNTFYWCWFRCNSLSFTDYYKRWGIKLAVADLFGCCSYRSRRHERRRRRQSYSPAKSVIFTSNGGDWKLHRVTQFSNWRGPLWDTGARAPRLPTIKMLSSFRSRIKSLAADSIWLPVTQTCEINNEGRC